MKRILLVIFFIASIISIIIYKNASYESFILYIGEKKLMNNIKYKSYDKFLYDNITYKELINSIKNNDYIIIKGRKIYLNQLISKANIIVIGANNVEYNKKCHKKNTNINYYKNKIEKDKMELLKIINKISSSKVEVISNYCKSEKQN